MIAAKQILFIGKVVQNPSSDRPKNYADRKLQSFYDIARISPTITQ